MTKRIFPVLFLALTLLTGCAKVAYYEKMVPAETDVGQIDRVAVADFDGLQQSGRIISAKISEGIVDAGYFKLLERQKLDRILEERDFSNSDYVDPSTVSDLKMLGVDALIFGVVDAYSVDDETGVAKIERKVGTGEYRTVEKKGKDGTIEKVEEEITETILVDRGYIIREGTMGVTFRMANINTGEVVAVKTETAHFSERAWRDERGKLPTKDVILDDLAFIVAHRFLRQIQPQFVRVKVEFEKNGNPLTKTGIKYAQAGLWDKAEEAFRQAAESSAYEPSVFYNLAVTSNVLGKHKSAIRAIERAIELNPSDKYINMMAQLRRDAQESEILEEQWGE
jgi:tetratricopeptide (TPR) repeat protein